MNEVTVLRPAPSHITRSRRLNLNAAAHANVTSSFAVLSYRGKNWSVKYRGNWEVLTGSQGTGHDGRPLPDMPLQYLDVVIVGLSPHISKTYYERGYTEGADEGPDCFSVTGISPDPASPKKQHTQCSVCPQNRFGSRITDQGKRAKKCTDYRRMAVVPAGDEENAEWGGPMMLRIPPMSLVNLDRYATDVAKKGADLSEVVTRLSFGATAYPQIEFKAIDWVSDADAYAQVVEHAEGEQVRRMLEAEVIEATADRKPEPPDATDALSRPRPAHMQQEPASPSPAPEPAPPPPPPPEQPKPAAVAAQPAPARVSPFRRPAPQAPVQGGLQPAPAAPAVPVNVMQMAPADLESVIDKLIDEPTAGTA